MNTVFGPLEDKVRGFEKRVVIAILRKVRGNVRTAARVAGRNRTQFYKLLKRYGLNPEEYRTHGTQRDSRPRRRSPRK